MSGEPLADLLRLMEADYDEAIRAGCDPHVAWESALEAGREFAERARNDALCGSCGHRHFAHLGTRFPLNCLGDGKRPCECRRFVGTTP